MQTAPLPKPILITRYEELENLARSLSRLTTLAVDTESNGLYAYQEQVCLVQFSTPQSDYLIDPLALQNLEPLADIFSNPQIEKIFHAAEYDILCLRRDFGFQFANIFDTMLAARILGRGELGLGAILKKEFGLELNKRFQRANWGQRPLPPELLAYARTDTRHLVALRERLYPALVQTGRLPLAQEDFLRLCKVQEHYDENNHSLLNITGASDLTPQQLAVLQELVVYRDHMARKMDRPHFKVINNDTLIAIAQHCPAKLDEMRQFPGMSPRQIERHGRSLLEAVRRGLRHEPLHISRPPRPSDAYLSRLDALRNWRKTVGKEMKVESDIILPKDLMQAIAESNPPGLDALQTVMADSPWRFARFGQAIMKVLPRKG